MIELEDWGLIDYNEAWLRQKELVEDIQKHRNRNVFILCEHPSVITIGKTGTKDNILQNSAFFEKLGIKVVETDRGGDVTLHNPGQMVGYPVFNLKDYREDLHWFLREIEECIIEIIARFGIAGGRVEGLTGVWIDRRRKICAIGMHCSRWVTSHGFALNVRNDLKEFNYIVPCGITNKEVSSIEAETGMVVDYDIVKSVCFEVFKNHF